MSDEYDVLFDFTAEDEGELSVRMGQVVVLNGPVADGWALVRILDDSDGTGYVPADFIAHRETKQPPAAENAPLGEEEEEEEEEVVVEPTAQPRDVGAQRGGRAEPSSRAEPGPARRSPAEPEDDAYPSPGTGRSMATPVVTPAYPGQYVRPTPDGRDNSPASPPQTRAQSQAQAQRGAATLPPSGRTAAEDGSGLRGRGTAGPEASSTALVPVAESGRSAARSATGRARRVRQPESLHAMATSEDFEQMMQNHQQWLDALSGSRAGAFDELRGQLDRLDKHLSQGQELNDRLHSRLDALCDLIEEERQNWESQLGDEAEGGASPAAALGAST